MKKNGVDLSGNVDCFVIDGDKLTPVNFRTTNGKESVYSQFVFGKRKE